MAKYITQTGDMLDRICYQYYGTTEVTSKVLEANRELAKLGAVLPSGVTIELPDIQKPTAKAQVKLW